MKRLRPHTRLAALLLLTLAACRPSVPACSGDCADVAGKDAAEVDGDTADTAVAPDAAPPQDTAPSEADATPPAVDSAQTEADTPGADASVGVKDPYCDDFNTCTDELYVALGKCVFTNNTGPCADPCGGVGVCKDGLCGSAQPKAYWTKAFGYGQIFDMAAGPDGSITLTHEKKVGSGLQRYLTRLSLAGEVLWSKQHAGSAVAVRPDGSAVVIAGKLLVTAADGSDGPIYPLAVPDQTMLYGISAAEDGSLAVCGLVGEPGSPSVWSNYEHNKPLAVRVEADGTTAWAKVLPFEDEKFMKITAHPAGGYVAIGSFHKMAVAPYQTMLFRVTRLDAAGNLVWTKKYGSPDAIGEIVVMGPGGMVMAVGETEAASMSLHLLDGGGSDLGQTKFPALQIAKPGLFLKGASWSSASGLWVIASLKFEPHMWLYDATGKLMWHRPLLAPWLSVGEVVARPDGSAFIGGDHVGVPGPHLIGRFNAAGLSCTDGLGCANPCQEISGCTATSCCSGVQPDNGGQALDGTECGKSGFCQAGICKQ